MRKPMIYGTFFRILIFFRVKAETAHTIASWSMRVLTAPKPVLLALHRLLAPRPTSLEVQVMGIDFRTPFGCAAGVDKSATWFDSLYALGFGFVEVGTVTARPQSGNPRPRVARLPSDSALLNSMGCPNDGAAKAAARLGRRRLPAARIGVNIGKSMAVELGDAVHDYCRCVRDLAPVADYVVLNVSSPNTPGLTQLQAVERLNSLIGGVREEMLRVRKGDVPLLVKISPDLSDGEIDAVADAAVESELDGIVAVNTTTDLAVAASSGEQIAHLPHRGGISGAPLRPRALAVLERLHGRVGGRIALVSVGGIETAEDAWDRILAGASLVQAHTGFVYGGPLWPRRINRGLARLAERDGFASVQDAVGKGQTATEAGLQTGLRRVGALSVGAR